MNGSGSSSDSSTISSCSEYSSDDDDSDFMTPAETYMHHMGNLFYERYMAEQTEIPKTQAFMPQDEKFICNFSVQVCKCQATCRHISSRFLGECKSWSGTWFFFDGSEQPVGQGMVFRLHPSRDHLPQEHKMKRE